MDPFVDPFQRRAPHKPWPKKWVSPIFGNPQIPPARTEKRVEYRVKNSFVEVAAVDPGHLSLEDKLGFCHRSPLDPTGNSVWPPKEKAVFTAHLLSDR